MISFNVLSAEYTYIFIFLTSTPFGQTVTFFYTNFDCLHATKKPHVIKLCLALFSGAGLLILEIFVLR